MKRSSLFGLIGVLAVVPYGFSLLIDSWGGRMLVGGMLLRRSDADLYAVIDRVTPLFTRPVIIFIYAACWALALGLAIRMLYAAWREHPLKGMTRGRYLLEISGRSAVVVAAAVFCSGPGLDAFFFYPPEGVMLLISSYGGPFGPLALYAFPVAQMAAYVFTICFLAHAAVSARSFKSFALRGAAGLAVASIVVAGLYFTARGMDLGSYLDSVPGVSDKTEPRTLVVLSEAPVVRPLYEHYNDCSVSDTFCRKIPSSRENAEAVKKYIEDRSYDTALRGAAFGLMALNSLRELDPAEALSVYVKALQVTGEATQGVSAQARLVTSPATPAYHGILTELGDEKGFEASGRAALRLGKAFERFGEMDRARHWHDKGMKTVLKLPERDREYFRITGKPPFNGGIITGRLTVDGRPAPGVRVGVARAPAARLLERKGPNPPGPVTPFFELQGISDGTPTDKDGRFVFTGLYEDEYMLLLSLADVEGRRYLVDSGPGVIKLSPSSPAVDAGTVNLALIER